MFFIPICAASDSGGMEFVMIFFSKISLLGKVMIRKLFMYIISRIYPIEKKIVFISFGGKQYSDNPREISEKMHGLYPNYKHIWIINEDMDKYSMIPSYVKKIGVCHRFKILKEMATAFCIISNNQFMDCYYKRPAQYYINTWHGNNPLKKILYDVLPEDEWPIRIADNKLVDLCISGSGFGSRLYGSAMHYYGRILEIGTPRNDCLVNEDIKRAGEVRHRLHIPAKCKVLLYAPTFRDNLKSKQNVFVDLERIMKLLGIDGDWRCLLRAHPASQGLKEEQQLPVIDVTHYPDMTDLILIADMLITDYSSCASDIILRNKPAIMAQFDYDDYRKKCRDFYFEMDELPFFIAKTQAELEEMIMGLTVEKVEENCRKIKEFYQINETGESAKEICKIIHAEYIRRFETKER